MSVSSCSFPSPWPDPNSSVLSKIDFGVPLPELFKWLDVRDTLLGDNKRKQDFSSALALARDCKHPDAEWLTSIFEGKDVATKEKVREVFLLHENDARALCFAWWLTDDRGNDLTLLRRAAEMGCAFACATFFFKVLLVVGKKNEAFRLAQLAVVKHERDGSYCLGYAFASGSGCEKDLNLARENYFIAAELGHVYAVERFGALLDESDPIRWVLWGRAASRGSPDRFLRSFSKQVEQFFSCSGNATVAFLIGRALKGNINVEKKAIFGSQGEFLNYYDWIGPANRAVSFYDSQIKSARLAVDTWTLVATRLHVIKDMRIFIAKMIWEGRCEANYEFIDASMASLRSLLFLPPDRKRSRK